MKRDFCIGSEWLYYKIYTGVKTADIILLEKLYPIIQELKTEKRIQKWFFIRYKDPDEHIRLRFYSENLENMPIIISRLYPILNFLLQENTIWKVQTDTYQRELERYGEQTITESETLFYQDSEMMLRYLSLKSSFLKKEMQLLFSFLAIDRFLNSFSLTNADRMKLMDELQTFFKKEFDADTNLKKAMSRQYQELSKDITAFLSGTAQNEYPEIYATIEKRESQLNKLAPTIKNNLQISLSNFLMSHIHMMINRQYTSQQRKYELIIYTHLYCYYKTIVYKQTSHVKNKFKID
ncbi:thiopeptide-type bacteriocin biosynthesis protein [Flavobacterium aestivum]|uniref:thiopeptide-type bacteriocin biosynthesis protein n=1 Tax=Flavobacterium aestivum TaxID=3003257 RepID=UPI002482E662|nr:thiopeptide-type bacteriocin biosynthesis protein [Flavobacterium aestivum]